MQARRLGFGRTRFKETEARGPRRRPARPSPQVLGASWAPKAGEMVCGGFACSKNALCALNVVYMVRLRRWGTRALRPVERTSRGFGWGEGCTGVPGRFPGTSGDEGIPGDFRGKRGDFR